MHIAASLMTVMARPSCTTHVWRLSVLQFLCLQMCVYGGGAVPQGGGGGGPSLGDRPPGGGGGPFSLGWGTTRGGGGKGRRGGPPFPRSHAHTQDDGTFRSPALW